MDLINQTNKQFLNFLKSWGAFLLNMKMQLISVLLSWNVSMVTAHRKYYLTLRIIMAQ